MDPITHAAIGLAAAKLTGNPIELSNPATLCILAGSLVPDIDILLQKKGDMTYLKNHRGATHSIVGVLISSAVISAVVGLGFGSTNYLALFLWALLGSSTHLFFDIFNSYGAKILWPFFDKKFSLAMMGSFDPVVAVILVGFVFSKTNFKSFLLVFLALYFLARAVSRWHTLKWLGRSFGADYNKISLLPSMKNIFKWHFILDGTDCTIVGEKELFRNKIKILKRMHKSNIRKPKSVTWSAAGKFFREFTPVYHVSCESHSDYNRYVYTDMRYFLKNKFLHHAVVDTDKSDNVIRQTFNPYSMKRCCVIEGS